VPGLKARWFGSMRITRDGRMRFSPWSFPDLPHVALSVVADGRVTVVSAGLPVMFLYSERNRILTACFVPDLKPDQLRMAVAELRQHVRGGLDRWIVPALEWNLFHSYVREDFPEAHRILPELLEACRDLPMAERWKRIREDVRTSADWSKRKTTGRRASTRPPQANAPVRSKQKRT